MIRFIDDLIAIIIIISNICLKMKINKVQLLMEDIIYF